MPAKPPLPWVWYLPFQPEAGSQTSILMSESFEGLSSAVTRQNAGAFLNTGEAAVLPGGVNAPAATDSAEVMAAPGSLRALKFSHGPAKASPAVKRIVTRRAAEGAAASGQRGRMLAERDSIFLHHCE